jgi:hypothetical protein
MRDDCVVLDHHRVLQSIIVSVAFALDLMMPPLRF